MNRYYHINYYNSEGLVTHRKVYTSTGKFIRMEVFDQSRQSFSHVEMDPIKKVMLSKLSSMKLNVVR